MHAVISLFLQSRKFWWYLLLTSSKLLHDVIMTSYCCQQYAECLGNDFVFQQDSALAHRATHVQQLNCCVKKCPTILRPACGLQTVQISVLWITRSGLSCSIMSTTDKNIVWMNWNDGSLMSGAVLNSRFLSRVSILTRDIDIANMSVRPSVRYVPVSHENGLTYRHSFFTIPYGSPIILVLPTSNIFTKFRRGHPLQGR